MLKVREVKDKFVKSLSNYWKRLGTPDVEQSENEVKFEYPTETQSRLGALELLVDPKYKAKSKRGDSQTVKRDNPVRNDGGRKIEEVDRDEREL